MTDKLEEFSKALNEVAVQHRCYHDCIHLDLPAQFGIMEIKFWPDGDDSIQLLEGDFHTHSEILKEEYGLPEPEAYATLVQKIFNGELLLVEEVSPEGNVRKTIENSMSEYLKYLPGGSSYTVKNET